jgi:hypothetical protein
MSNEDKSVTKRLLEDYNNSKNKMENKSKMEIKNEKTEKIGSGGGGEREPDLRLHDAVCDPENIEEIENLIEENPQLLYERDHGLRTPLHTVVIDGTELIMIHQHCCF